MNSLRRLTVIGGLSLLADAALSAKMQDPISLKQHLDVHHRVRDLLQHPAFSGHAQLIMPSATGAYDVEMALSEIARLLPYHTNVKPREMVATLNRMIDDVSAGQPVFYEFYTPVEKQREPSKAQTGLFFFRGNPGAPFAVIAPGGGFSYVGSMHEGFPYATEINKQGYNAFVLVYRVGQGGTAATQDLAAALSFIFRHADRLGLSTRGYSLWGSSAGARMVAAIGTHGAARFGGDSLPRPAAVVMAYTAHSEYSLTDPPTFAVVGEDDRIAPPDTMQARVDALRKAGVKIESHRYPGVGHGFGLGSDTSAQGWLQDAIRFWELAGTR